MQAVPSIECDYPLETNFGKELLDEMGKSRRSFSNRQLLGLGISSFYDDLDSDSLPHSTTTLTQIPYPNTITRDK